MLFSSMNMFIMPLYNGYCVKVIRGDDDIIMLWLLMWFLCSCLHGERAIWRLLSLFFSLLFFFYILGPTTCQASCVQNHGLQPWKISTSIKGKGAFQKQGSLPLNRKPVILCISLHVCLTICRQICIYSSINLLACRL